MGSNIKHYVASEEGLLTTLLSTNFKVDQTIVLNWLRLGSIYLNKKRIFGDTPLKKGDYLRVHSEPRRYAKPSDLKNRILDLDANLVVIDKPSGSPCHATVDNGAENLLAWIQDLIGHPVWITHRLDVPTQGCLVIARSSHAAGVFNKLLMNSLLNKTYYAWVEGNFPILEDSTVRHWMVDESWAPRKIKDKGDQQDMECLLEVLSQEYNSEYKCTLLKLKLITGRTHQIRAQVAHMGHPILGDQMYGSKYRHKNRIENEVIALQANTITFPDPWENGRMRSYTSQYTITSPEEFILN